jgi:hypothetical protein
VRSTSGKAVVRNFQAETGEFAKAAVAILFLEGIGEELRSWRACVA